MYNDCKRCSGAHLSARARRGEDRAPSSISRRRASKRCRRLGARPSPSAGRFG
ncbi:hypothetical protein GW17_00058825 [Ensete ventricosum]|nr:hypothetical protein GW17_00058825 [Ensete ventricosum]